MQKLGKNHHLHTIAQICLVYLPN